MPFGHRFTRRKTGEEAETLSANSTQTMIDPGLRR